MRRDTNTLTRCRLVLERSDGCSWERCQGYRGQELLGLLLVLDEVLADGEASLGLLQHGEVLGRVEGQEVLEARAATEGVSHRLVKNHEVLVFLEFTGSDAVLDPVTERLLRAERLVQMAGVNRVDEAVEEVRVTLEAAPFPKEVSNKSGQM